MINYLFFAFKPTSGGDIMSDEQPKIKAKDDYPIVIEVKHVQELLNVGRKQAYDLVNEVEAKCIRKRNPEFHVFRVGASIKINRDSFFSWIDGMRK